MSDITLENALINVGGILTETYVRDTRATNAAKEELGLNPEGTYKAGIGIANIDEFLVMTAKNITKNNYAYFDLSQFDQALKLESIFIDRAAQDQIIFDVYDDDGQLLISQVFNRDATPIQLPSAPLPPTVKIVIKAVTDISYLQLCFKTCAIISATNGVIYNAIELDKVLNGSTPPQA